MRIAIVGLGQIGGSMALKLRSLGYNPDLFDLDPQLCQSLNGKCEQFKGHGYDLVILALYADVILKIMDDLPRDNLYLDTASVKAPIVKKASEIGLKFVGGHPIAGNEKSGKDSWDLNLFEDRPFAIVKTNVDDSSIKIVMKFVEMIGSKPVMIDAELHDKAIVYTSQGLYFISKAVKELGLPYEALAGPGYASMTRLSKQNPLLEETFKKYNSKNISEFLKEMIKALEIIAKDLER